MVKWMKSYGAYLLAFILLAALAYGIRVVLVPFVLAAFLTYLLEPVVAMLTRRGVHRVGAIWLTYFALALAAILAALVLVPSVVDELNRLAEVVPLHASDLRMRLEELQSDYSRLPVPEGLRTVLDQALERAETQLVQGVSAALGGTVAFMGNMVRILITPVLAYYMLRDLPQFRNVLRARMGHHQEWVACLGDIDQVVGGFVRAQFIVGLIVGALTALTLTVLGVRFAILLGLVAFAGEFVPYFGPIISALSAIAVALLTAPFKALPVALAVVLIQQVESGIITPKIVGDRTGLHPLLVILLVLSGGYLFGIWGLLLAVPLGAVTKVGLCCVWSTRQAGRISPNQPRIWRE